jgi:type IV pilus assembly protein PilB
VWELQAAFETTAIEPFLITPTDLKRIWTAIELGFVHSDGDATQPAPHTKPTESIDTEIPASLEVEDSRIVGLLDAILLDAVAERASDIHLERYPSDSRLRFRIDGSLRDVDRYHFVDEDFAALVNVIKITAGLDIAERRMPQGGRIRRRLHSQTYDLRVQTQPTLFHESLVIRILPQDRRPPSIEDLGFQPSAADRYRRLLRDPQGLILIVGATGSGKSTTIYAGLQMLAKDTSRKVITIEDPIEFFLPGIQQTQVNAAVGYRFAEAIRSFLRQDPDVVLVGEVRDSETALEAIRAAQTGHLVLATLHCNDTVDAVQRLTDLGMSANSIASELTAVIAQRLARRICTHCREATLPDVDILAELYPHGAPADFQCFEGRGCDRCRGSGAYGRIAVVEFLQVGPDIRRAIANQVVVDDLRILAAKSDMQSLRDSAIELVKAGVIQLSELYDILSAEQMRPLEL